MSIFISRISNSQSKKSKNKIADFVLRPTECGTLMQTKIRDRPFLMFLMCVWYFAQNIRHFAPITICHKWRENVNEQIICRELFAQHVWISFGVTRLPWLNYIALPLPRFRWYCVRVHRIVSVANHHRLQFIHLNIWWWRIRAK